MPSKTESGKRAVDEKLKRAAGYIGQDEDFKRRINEVTVAFRKL